MINNKLAAHTTNRATWKGILFALALLVLLYCALQRVTLAPFGDAQVNQRQWLTLNNDYFPHNWTILKDKFSGSATTNQPIKLRTEGGSAFLLGSAQKIHQRAPYYLNGFFLIGLVILIFILFRISTPFNYGHYWSMAFFFLVLFHSTSLNDHFWQLVHPFRDTTAHFFMFMGLILFLSGLWVNNGKIMFFSGMALGFSIWHRLPSLLMVVTCFCIWVSFQIARKKFSWRTSLFLGSGFVVGILPLIFQNILEGANGFHLPQQDSLLLSNAPKEILPGLRRGLHYVNFPNVALHTARAVIGSIHWSLHLFWIPLCWACRKSHRLRWTSFTLALFIFINWGFYSCYDHVVTRYIFPSSLCMILLLALGATSLLWLTALHKRRPMAALLIFACSISLGLQIREAHDQRNNFKQSFVSRAYFDTWWAKNGNQNDSYICNIPMIPNWIRESGGKGLRLSTEPLSRQTSIDTIKREIGNGATIYYLSTRLKTGALTPSWWRTMLATHFVFEPALEPLNIDMAFIQSAHFYRLRLPDNSIVVLPAEAGKSSFYMVLNQPAINQTDSIAKTRRIPVTVNGNDTHLATGINLINHSDHQSNAPFQIHGDLPLHIIDSAPLIVNQPWGFYFSDYALHPLGYGLLSNFTMHGDGSGFVNRDHGGFPKPKYYVVPRFYLHHESTIHLPYCAKPMDNFYLLFRLYIAGKARDPGAAIQQIEGLSFTRNEQSFEPTIQYLEKPYARGTHYAQDAILEWHFPVADLTNIDNASIQIHQSVQPVHKYQGIVALYYEATLLSDSKSTYPANLDRHEKGWLYIFHPRPYAYHPTISEKNYE